MSLKALKMAYFSKQSLIILYFYLKNIIKIIEMENVKNLFVGMPWYLYLLLLLVFGLFLASWIIPPLGIINASVLQAGAIVLGFAWLFYVSANIPTFIHRGAKISATYGNANLTIEDSDENDNEDINY